jgi:hypothetical protein
LKNPLQTKVAIKRLWQESLHKLYKGKCHVGTIKIMSTRIQTESFLKEYEGVKEFPLNKSPRTLKSCLKRLGVPKTFDHIWVEILFIRDNKRGYETHIFDWLLKQYPKTLIGASPHELLVEDYNMDDDILDYFRRLKFTLVRDGAEWIGLYYEKPATRVRIEDD